ncbi:MAG: rod-binding protein [Alphaproteobacteria bacterium]|nr:rod-binding protein [Alphaproteobacteria bacterium]
MTILPTPDTYLPVPLSNDRSSAPSGLPPSLASDLSSEWQIGKRNISESAARKAAQSFEAFFLRTALEDMSKGLSVDHPFGGGNAENVWRGFLNEELGKSMAEAGGIGLADIVERELLGISQITQPPRQQLPAAYAGNGGSGGSGDHTGDNPAASGSGQASPPQPPAIRTGI